MVERLPPIASALEHFAAFLRAATMPPGQTIPAAPIRQQVRQMNALLGDVADVERQLAAAQAELEKIKPAEDFLAICQEIYRERIAQDLQHGGPDHDDTLAPTDWADAIEYQLERIAARPPRECLLHIAALAVAAMQSLDRKPAFTPERETADA